MTYQVVVPKKVQRELNRINKKYRIRILAALTVLGNNPYLGKKLKGKYKGKWSHQVWPYRIIYKIKKQALIVLILYVGHRQGVYKWK